MKKGNQAHYHKYFGTFGIIQNTWKGIKFLIFLKTVTSSVPTALSLDTGDTISNPFDTAQSAFTCLKLTIETLEQGVKYAQS